MECFRIYLLTSQNRCHQHFSFFLRYMKRKTHPNMHIKITQIFFLLLKSLIFVCFPHFQEVVNKKKKFRFSPVWCGCCCLCCCESDPLFLEARILGTGYTPRQTIDLLLTATNTSSQDISEFKIELIRVSCVYLHSFASVRSATYTK